MIFIITKKLNNGITITAIKPLIVKNGDVLHKHTDRGDCEYSVSLTLKREDGDEIWPLYLETDKTYKALLEEGDGLIYKGVENHHWRDKFDGERLAQVFLHYVGR